VIEASGLDRRRPLAVAELLDVDVPTARSREEDLSVNPRGQSPQSSLYAPLPLLNVLSVLEHEGDALRDVDELRDVDDLRVHGVLQAMQQTRAEIVAAVAARGSRPGNSDRL
jgi:hypothetical protein